MAQQQALGMGIQGFSSQTALDLLQVSLYDTSTCNKSVCHCRISGLCCRSAPWGAVRVPSCNAAHHVLTPFIFYREH